MEIKTENPWYGKDLEQFLFYCCPECDTKNKSRDGFMKHITQHPDALEFIKDVKVIKVPSSDNLDNNKQDLKSEPEIFMEDDDYYDNGDDEFVDVDYEPKTEDISDDEDKDPSYLQAMAKLSSLGSVKVSRQSEPKETSFTCKLCNTTVQKKVDLRNHDRLNHVKVNDKDEEMFYCDLCELFFVERSEFRLHVNRDHDGSCKMYPCPSCDKSFGRPSLVEKHQQLDHSGRCDTQKIVKKPRKKKEPAPEDSQTGDFPCIFCKLTLSNPKDLKRHYNKIHKELLQVCSYCHRGFPDSEALKQHKKEYHQGKKYQCPECGKCLTGSAKTLENHIQRVHNGVKDQKLIQCPQCGKMLHSTYQLKFHIKAIHEKIYDYTCELCGKKFARPMNLKRHQEINHENVRNHTCNVCGRSFYYKDRMINHIKKVHMKIKEYFCNLCDSSFGESHHLKTHIKLKHKLEVTHQDLLDKGCYRPSQSIVDNDKD